MDWSFIFFFNSILLGAGLAMDAFSVSLANGLSNPCMKKPQICGIAGVFAFFQFAMPMIGWICVHTIVEYFRAFEKAIPWIALLLLLYIGGGMLRDGIREIRQNDDAEAGTGEAKEVGLKLLIMQGIATSIDALSVGFTIASYNAARAFEASLIIAAVTFVICMGGLLIGKKIGTRVNKFASIFGGIILIAIGIEIFITGV